MKNASSRFVIAHNDSFWFIFQNHIEKFARLRIIAFLCTVIVALCHRRKKTRVARRAIGSYLLEKGRLRTLSSDVESRKFKAKKMRNGASALGV